MQRQFKSLVDIQDSKTNITESDYQVKYSSDSTIEVDVSFVIYLIGVITFLSWIIFSILGGIGLAAIPLDFFNDFCTRPKSIKSSDITRRKDELVTLLKSLKDLGDDISVREKKGDHKKFFLSKDKRQYNSKIKEFKQGYLVAEEEFHIVNISEEMKKNGDCIILLYYLLIPLGIITSIFTTLWVIQFICTYFYMKSNKQPGYPFLSHLFIFFQDNDVGFLSFFFFAFLSLYLLWATIKGNIKFGGRIFCCVSIYPMKKDETYMNAFLFNITLILLSSFAIIQFCSVSFADYVSFTDIDNIFNVQVKYLKFFKIFYVNYIFEYIFFGIFVISFLILLFCRKNTRYTISDEYNTRKRHNMLREIKVEDTTNNDLQIKNND